MSDAPVWARFAVALPVIVAAVWLMARRADVRLVLLGAGLLLSFAAGTPLAVPDAFTRAMSNVMVGPICASLGFAAVLAATGCDRHLVRLLLLPVRGAGWAALPGGVLAAYLVNLAVPSQTSAAAAVGPILVPLLLAGGVPARGAAAALLLGASFGGDLLNPGSQDIQALAGVTGLSAHAIHARLVPAALSGIAAASLTLTLLTRPTPPAAAEKPAEETEALDFLRAIIPLVPTALLLLAYGGCPGLGWLVTPPGGKEWAEFAGALPVVRAMLIGSALALAVCWRDAGAIGEAFFKGTGVAYGTIIALTITAQCFGAGFSALGLGKALLGVAGGASWSLGLLALGFPWGLGLLTGSGSGPVLTFAEAVLKAVPPEGEPVKLAALACLGGAFGRTLSPVSAVVLYCCGVADVRPLDLVRRVLPALLAGAAVAVAVLLAGVRLP